MSNRKTAERPTAIALIEDFRVDLLPIAGEAGLDFDRLKSGFNIAVQKNPDILNVDSVSLRRELMKCAFDGLVPDGKEAVILPYENKKKGIVEANYQPMVYGVIKRLRELGDVFQITCNLVYDLDTYEENEADPDSLVHRSPGFNKERGEIVGGYVIFRDEQRRVMHFEKMSVSDFEAVRKASKAPESPAWRNWYGEMCKKAVLRRGSKYISTNNDRIRALIERQDSMFDMQQTGSKTIERSNPFGGPTIDLAPSGEEISSSSLSSEHDASHGSDKAGAASTQSGAASDPKPKPLEVKDADRPTLDMLLNEVVDLTDPMPMVTPEDRLSVIKAKSQEWKGKLPEYLHDTLKWVMGMSTTAIKAQQAEEAWQPPLIKGLAQVKAETGIEFKQGWL